LQVGQECLEMLFGVPADWKRRGAAWQLLWEPLAAVVAVRLDRDIPASCPWEVIADLCILVWSIPDNGAALAGTTEVVPCRWRRDHQGSQLAGDRTIRLAELGIRRDRLVIWGSAAEGRGSAVPPSCS
jgi:hypothetical protein